MAMPQKVFLYFKNSVLMLRAGSGARQGTPANAGGIQFS